MTRQEAIEQLRNLKQANFFSSTIMALDMAIEALSADIPPEHDGCKDCRYEANDEHEYPCKDCKQNYTDKGKPKRAEDRPTGIYCNATKCQWCSDDDICQKDTVTVVLIADDAICEDYEEYEEEYDRNEHWRYDR